MPANQRDDPKAVAGVEAHMREFSQRAAPVLPYLSQMAPDAMGVFGRRANISLMASELVSHDMTADDASSSAKGAQDVMDDGGHRGFGGANFANWLRIAREEGRGPSDRTGAGVGKWLQTEGGGYAAMRDLMPELQTSEQRQGMVKNLTLNDTGMTGVQAGMHIRTLGEAGAVAMGADPEHMSLRQRNVGLQKFAGIQASAGEYSRKLGGRAVYGQEAAVHAAGLAGARRQMGLADEDLNLAGVTSDELSAQDAGLTVQARMSRGFNDLAATMRLGGEKGPGFKAGTQGEAMYTAMQEGRSTYKFGKKEFGVQEGDWQDIMAKGLKGKNTGGIAAATRSQRASNQSALNEDQQGTLTNIIRNRQWEEDIEPRMQAGIAGALQGANPRLRNSRAAQASGVISDTLRNLNIDPTKIEGGTEAERQASISAQQQTAVSSALNEAGFDKRSTGAMASAGISGADTVAKGYNAKNVHHLGMLHNEEMLKRGTGVEGKAKRAAAEQGGDSPEHGGTSDEVKSPGRRIFDAVGKSGEGDSDSPFLDFIRRATGMQESANVEKAAAAGSKATRDKQQQGATREDPIFANVVAIDSKLIEKLPPMGDPAVAAVSV